MLLLFHSYSERRVVRFSATLRCMKRDARYKPQDLGGKQAVFLPARSPFPCLFRPHDNSPSARHFGFRQRLYLYSSHIFSTPLLYPPAPQLSIRFLHIIFSPRFPPFVDNVRKTLGLCPKPRLGDFFRRSPLRTFKTFNAIGLLILSLHCADFGCSHVPCYEFRLLRAKSRRAGFVRLTPLSATG